MSDEFFGFGALPADLAARIVADEVGLEFGIHGEFRLRCVIQPVFQHTDGRLTPVAVDSQVVAYRQGSPVPFADFMAGVADEDRAVVVRMCEVLPLANVHNIGVDNISLIFRHAAGADATGLADVSFMAQRLGDEGFPASQLICELDAADETVAAELRVLGLGIALGHHGAGQPDVDAARRIGAEVVRLDRTSFERFCADVATGRLLKPVVSELKAQGAQVLVEGIDSERHLEVALGAGVDLLQGDLLEPAMQVGGVFDEGIRQAAQYRRGDCVVIPLFG